MANPIEVLFRPFFKSGILDTASASNQIAGVTTLNSGSATVAVSTTAVKSYSVFLMGLMSTTNQSSGLGTPIEVRSISHGNFVLFGTQTGNALPRNTDIHWMMFDRQV